MGFYDEDIAMALEMIEEFGQAVVWNSFIDGAPADAAKPWKPSAGSTTPHNVEIAFLPREEENQKTVQYRDETEIATGFIQGLMGQVSDFVPKQKDIVVRGSVSYIVETIDTIEPNSKGVILYTLEFSIGSLGI